MLLIHVLHRSFNRYNGNATTIHTLFSPVLHEAIQILLWNTGTTGAICAFTLIMYKYEK